MEAVEDIINDNNNYIYPTKYSLSHYIFGFLSYYNKYLIILILFYQIIQLILNKRFFFFCEEKIQDGNSIIHTLNKIIEYALGYVIAWILTLARNYV